MREKKLRGRGLTKLVTALKWEAEGPSLPDTGLFKMNQKSLESKLVTLVLKP